MNVFFLSLDAPKTKGIPSKGIREKSKKKHVNMRRSVTQFSHFCRVRLKEVGEWKSNDVEETR